VWFITGTSKGFGRIWAEAALERGDKVAATARNPAALAPLTDRFGDAALPIRLDVTDQPGVDAAVARAHGYFDRLDVIVNNAGYGLFGTIEEILAEQARAQLETNFFGALWVTKAAMPYLRAQRSGHIIQVSTISGMQAFPTVGLYNASKWALEGFSQALAAEVREFGIKVTLIEPKPYQTDWNGPSAVRATELPVYDNLRAHLDEWLRDLRGNPGDPGATGPAIVELVDEAEPPLRVFFGVGPLEIMREEYARRIATWEKWSNLSRLAEGDQTSARNISPVRDTASASPSTS
jgi:NAD(P)-dependent dehydrogenase (short-subunit alcohol dehydrogenase family)